MSEFIKVATISDLADEGKVLLEVEDRLVVLVRVENEYHCIDDVCTHDSGPLADGELDGCHLICPRHGARFDVRDGSAVTMPATQATDAHEVKVEGEDIYVKINE